jgi:DNA-binding ferritin-like protein (Dps family)
MTRPVNSQPLAPTHFPPYHEPRTVEDVVQQNITTIIHLNKAARAQRTETDRIVDAITVFCGSLVQNHSSYFERWRSCLQL